MNVFVFIFALLPLFALGQSKLIGTWHGELNLGMQKLPLVIHLADSANSIATSLDSPLQGAKGIPAKAAINGDSLKVEVPMLMASYDGVWRDGAIEGKFKQQGYSFPLNLAPGDYIPPRPQTPKPPFIYATEEVQFTNHDDAAVLAGTLTHPLTFSFKKDEKVPVVVMVTGSGLQNRDEEIVGHKPFAVLAHHLALKGIASLRYDDRGFGKSTGDVENATTKTFASDALAAINMLRKNDKFCSVGILGHSEGGTIAMMIAADGKADFAVSLAGTMLPGDSVLIDQNVRILKASGLDDATSTEYGIALGRLFDFMKKNPGAKQWNGLENAIADQTRLSPAMKANLPEILKQRNNWMDYFLAYNPAAAIKKCKVPVMAINGELDCQVNCSANLNAISRNLPNNAKSVTKSYPGLNHLFQHAQTGLTNEYGTIEETISPEVITDIINWILANYK